MRASLEEADYIVCTKSFDGRLPKTEYRLAAAGRKALERYLNHMEALIRATPRGLGTGKFFCLDTLQYRVVISIAAGASGEEQANIAHCPAATRSNSS